MFDDIGGKIKTLALVTCVIGIFASVISGLVMIVDGSVIGLVTIIAGSLLSWVGSFFTYGFGELIDYTVAIYEELNKKRQKNTLNNPKTPLTVQNADTSLKALIQPARIAEHANSNRKKPKVKNHFGLFIFFQKR